MLGARRISAFCITFPRLSERLSDLTANSPVASSRCSRLSGRFLSQPELIIFNEATEGLVPLIVVGSGAWVEQIRSDGIATLMVDRAAVQP